MWSHLEHSLAQPRSPSRADTFGTGIPPGPTSSATARKPGAHSRCATRSSRCSRTGASVEAAQAAVDLARQSLDAEQKKYALGASTSTLVLQNQSALATAESNLVSAMAAYEKARLELDQATGHLAGALRNLFCRRRPRPGLRTCPSVPDAVQRQEEMGSQPSITASEPVANIQLHGPACSGGRAFLFARLPSTINTLL